MPQIPALIAMARACRVSIDFLLLGADEPPASLLDWLETPTGQSVQRAEPEAIAFLRAMPVHGYRPRGTVFWDLAYQAWKHGLHDPDRVSRTARDTERHDD